MSKYGGFYPLCCSCLDVDLLCNPDNGLLYVERMLQICSKKISVICRSIKCNVLTEGHFSSLWVTVCFASPKGCSVWFFNLMLIGTERAMSGKRMFTWRLSSKSRFKLSIVNVVKVEKQWNKNALFCLFHVMLDRWFYGNFTKIQNKTKVQKGKLFVKI